MLDSCSIDKLSIEIYKNKIFNSDFTPIHVYMFKLSFLTTLSIYKDYFKVCHSRYKCVKLDAMVFHKHIVTEDICLSLFFSSRSYCVCTPQGFLTKEIRDLHRVDELKNFSANILLKLVVSHVLGSVHQLVSHILRVVH